MALREIIKDGDPCLRKTCRPVTVFDLRLRELAMDMLETMRANDGVGLAAPQVGILKRVFVMDMYDGSGEFIIINPVISDESGEQRDYEGCLSFPNRFGSVLRPEKLKLTYQDLSGDTQTLEAEARMAVCICHETDHLNGILLPDRADGPLFTPKDDEEEPSEEEKKELQLKRRRRAMIQKRRQTKE